MLHNYCNDENEWKFCNIIFILLGSPEYNKVRLLYNICLDHKDQITPYCTSRVPITCWLSRKSSSCN